MPIMRFDLDTEQDVEELTTELLLFASNVFNHRFPKAPDVWSEAMLALAEKIQEHVSHNVWEEEDEPE